MAYYATVRDDAGKRTVFAAGPFNRHGDAQRCVGHVHRLVGELFKAEAAWAGYGTTRVESGPMAPGKFNERLGLPTTGRITELPLPDNRWWTEGDPHWDPPIYKQKRPPYRTERRHERREARKARRIAARERVLSDETVLKTCPHCSEHFFYHPQYHRCPGTWEDICARAGAEALTDPYKGMSWVEEQMTRQYEERTA